MKQPIVALKSIAIGKNGDAWVTLLKESAPELLSAMDNPENADILCIFDGRYKNKVELSKKGNMRIVTPACDFSVMFDETAYGAMKALIKQTVQGRSFSGAHIDYELQDMQTGERHDITLAFD